MRETLPQREPVSVNTSKLRKEIGWSYPTSPNAVRFGFPFGCWTLALTDGQSAPRTVAAYDRSTDAINAADAMPHEWSRYSFQNRGCMLGECNDTLSGQSLETAATA